jgi:hypothetical protein
MPALSIKMRRAMAIAEHQQLHDFASTSEENLPLKKKAKK